MRNVSSTLVFSSISLNVFWLGRQITPSATDFNCSRLCCACCWRRLPSHTNGSVTNASTSAPVSFAARASTGLMPLPAPPPRPATMKTTSAPSHAVLSVANCSSAMRAAAFGIAAGAQPAQQLGFEMNFHRRGRRRQRLPVRVDRRKTCAGKFLAVQRVEQADARAADAEDFDRRARHLVRAPPVGFQFWFSWRIDL